MKHVMSATALLRLLTMLFVAQDWVLVDVSAQLNNAEQEVININVTTFLDDITEGLKRIENAQAAVLQTYGIYPNKSAEIDPLLNYITQVINKVNTKLVSLVNVTSLVNESVQPWSYAISICNSTNSTIGSQVCSQYSLINQLYNNTLSLIYSGLTVYKQDAAVIQTALANLKILINTTFSNYNSSALAERCSKHKECKVLYVECVNNITQETIAVINGNFIPELQIIINATNNLTIVANANLSVSVATQLNVTNRIATTEGGKILAACNVTTDTIEEKTKEPLKSFNVTPIHTYAANVKHFADNLMNKSTEMQDVGNYMLYSSIYVMNDAIGSASYITGWKYPFTNETNYAKSVIQDAIRKSQTKFPNVTQDASNLYATASDINSRLDHQVSLLAPSYVNTKCNKNLTEYYEYYKCVNDSVNSFGSYYKNELKTASNASDTAYKLLVNDTAKLAAWRDTVVAPESALVVEQLQPIAEKLLVDYNCTVDKLLGYAVHIIDQRYAQYNPNITSMAKVIFETPVNATPKNQSLLDIRPQLDQLLQPLNHFIAVVKNSTNQTVLTEDVLNAPAQFTATALSNFQAFLQNITTQAQIIKNNTKAFVDSMELQYQGLNYTSLYNKCYNASSPYPLIELVACYNRLHYNFYLFLDKGQARLKDYVKQITDLANNVDAIISNYTNTLLAEFKQNVCVYTAIVYQKAGLPVPPELRPCIVPPDGRCKIQFIIDGQPKCVIYY